VEIKKQIEKNRAIRTVDLEWEVNKAKGNYSPEVRQRSITGERWRSCQGCAGGRWHMSGELVAA
jgi:hypothetical protein